MNVKLTNKMYADNEDFKQACAAAGIQPTARQASKFRRGLGLAFKAKNKKA